jgi:hypothetical protein
MTILTPEIAVRLGIIQGRVYNFTHKTDVQNHYFIVLNSAPQACQSIHLAMFTTQKDSLKRRISTQNLHMDVYVEVNDGECTFLPRSNESCVDCSRPLILSIDELINLIETTNDGVCDFPEIDDSLLQRICAAVQLNKLISPRIKGECGYGESEAYTRDTLNHLID